VKERSAIKITSIRVLPGFDSSWLELIVQAPSNLNDDKALEPPWRSNNGRRCYMIGYPHCPTAMPEQDNLTSAAE
jgi:hypothetical protein